MQLSIKPVIVKVVPEARIGAAVFLFVAKNKAFGKSLLLIDNNNLNEFNCNNLDKKSHDACRVVIFTPLKTELKHL